MTVFPHLFTPLRIGPLELGNRVIQLATTNNLDDGGSVGERQIAFYAERAKAGVGMIVTEGLAAHSSTQGANATSQGRGRVGAYEPGTIAGLQRLAAAIHSHDTPVIGQVLHGGRQHHADGIPLVWGPSAVPCPHSGGTPHALTVPEIHSLVDSFGAAAAALQSAGFDGVEVHGAQGHLIQEFFSPFSNVRTDDYGGSIENRMRFGFEILKAVRERCGADFVVGMRLGAEEQSPGGIDRTMACELAARIAAHGEVDYLSVTVGNFKSIEIHTPDRHHERMQFTSYAADIKRVVGDLPVVTCGRIIEPAAAEGILAAGDADMIGLCRPLLADAEWVAKAREGREDEIRRCISCNQCWGSIIDERPVNCIHNAATGRELEWGIGTLRATDEPRRVAVVGAGPAGMEAARIAAERGHHVTLYEARDDIGGSVRYASHIEGHEETGYVISFLQQAMDRAGVDARTGTACTAEELADGQHDAVVVATGALPDRDALGDTGSLPVYTSHEVARGEADVSGRRVVLFDEDGYYQACEVAEQIARTAAEVVMVTRFWEVGREIPATSRVTTLRALDDLGVRITPTTWFGRVRGSDVVLVHELSHRESVVHDVDAIVYVGRSDVQDGLARELEGRVGEVHLVGDAFMPRRIADAIFEGHRVGRAL